MALGTLAQRGDTLVLSTQPPLPCPQQVPSSWPCSLLSRTDEVLLSPPFLPNMEAFNFPFALEWAARHPLLTAASCAQRIDPGCHIRVPGLPISRKPSGFPDKRPRETLSIVPWSHLSHSEMTVPFCKRRTTVILLGDSGEERSGSHRGLHQQLLHPRAFYLMKAASQGQLTSGNP